MLYAEGPCPRPNVKEVQSLWLEEEGEEEEGAAAADAGRRYM